MMSQHPNDMRMGVNGMCGRVRAVGLDLTSESTVCREIRRNATRNGKNLWTLADESATRRKCRAPGNRTVKPEVRWRVEQLIKDEQWSPKQISGFLAKEGIHISHETIYRFIREDETGELAQNCCHKMKYA